MGMTHKGRPEKAVKRRGRKPGRKPVARVEVTLGMILPVAQADFVSRVAKLAGVSPGQAISVLMAVAIIRGDG